MKEMIKIDENKLKWGDVANRHMRRYAEKVTKEVTYWYPYATPSEIAKMVMDRLYDESK